MIILNELYHQPQANSFYLNKVTWDDYSYWTSFKLNYYDTNSKAIYIGELKIAKKNQGLLKHTIELLPDKIQKLDPDFFSLGQNPEYYDNLTKNLSETTWRNFLKNMRDIAFSRDLYNECHEENWLNNSLTRYISETTIFEQFHRILNKGEKLAAYEFKFTEHNQNFELEFKITPNSNPPSNLHVITGRNGSGKTSTLKKIAKSITRINDKAYSIQDKDGAAIDNLYFSKAIYASFSVFDNPLLDIEFGQKTADTTSITYIGLHKEASESRQKTQPTPTEYSIKNKADLAEEFCASVTDCILSSENRKQLWKTAVRTLESDINFEDKSINELLNIGDKGELTTRSRELFLNLSSGHAAVLYTITKLVELTEEKTVVIFDEPENHLHPPLLSAFVRALSELLAKKNGISIISTHSPVVLQEVPSSCAWKITTLNDETITERPSIQTFAENIGTLTHEIFGLEVQKSGFLALLKAETDETESYDEILKKYNKEIGLEGRAMLRSILANKKPK